MDNRKGLVGLIRRELLTDPIARVAYDVARREGLPEIEIASEIIKALVENRHEILQRAYERIERGETNL